MKNLPFIPDGSTVKAFGNGLINKSWRVDLPGKEQRAWLLQQINTKIFTDVEALTSNILLVTDHIREKLIIKREHDIERRVLTPIQINPSSGSRAGKYYYRDSSGNYWRVFKFIENSFSFERMENPALAECAGRAFGDFHRVMSDFPGNRLYEVLPGFHYTPGRISSLKKRVEADSANRLKNCRELADLLLSREEEFSVVAKMGAKGELPLRVVHQDTKLNNVLFDSNAGAENPQMLCIVDLDTVMPGYLCYDVGDAIRSGANSAAEDERDLAGVFLNLQIYRSFIDGFISVVKDFITPAELESIPLGPKLLTYEQSVRFLDDYLAGDIYYKTEYEEHNLVRAMAQAKLLESMDGLI